MYYPVYNRRRRCWCWCWYCPYPYPTPYPYGYGGRFDSGFEAFAAGALTGLFFGFI